MQSACEKPSCITGWNSPDVSNLVSAGGDFGAENARLGTTLSSPSEKCTHSSGIFSPSRYFPVMSSDSTASEISDYSSFGPSTGAPRESLSVWSLLDGSGSVHGRDDENDGIPGCGGTGDWHTGSG